MLIIKKGDASDLRKAKAQNDRQYKAEVEKIRRGTRSKNAGFSEPGYNFGLGMYVKDKAHYNKVVREMKAVDPGLEHS